MYCVKNRHSIEDIIKKSRFIGVVIPCDNEQEVIRQLQQLHQEHPSATHIAYAFRLKTDHGLVYRFHDAGEPTGTAGKPIFQHLGGKGLINLLVAVIRYFGGVKLGAGGLTRAYGNAAKRVIDSADILPFVKLTQVMLTVSYAQLQPLEYALKKLGGRIVRQEFAEQVRVQVELPAEQLDALLHAFPASQST